MRQNAFCGKLSIARMTNRARIVDTCYVVKRSARCSEWTGLENNSFLLVPSSLQAKKRQYECQYKVRTTQLATQACLSNACSAAGESAPPEGAEVCSSHWRGSVPDSPGPGGCCTAHCKPWHVRPNAMPIDAWQPVHPYYLHLAHRLSS